MQPTLTFILVITALTFTIAACSTPAPGVKQNPLGTSTTVAAEPAQVADAAEVVLNDLSLQDVTKASTAVDGLVTGTTAQGKAVKVTITSAGARTSNVSVNHSAGSGVALQIVQGIEKELEPSK